MKNPIVSTKYLQKSLAHANTFVLQIYNKKNIKQEWNSWEDTTEEATDVQKNNNIAAHLKFAKENLDYQQHSWQNILQTDETKIDTQHFVWRKKGTAHKL